MTVWNLTQHTYEEVRETIIDILLGREDVGPAPQQFDDVIAKVRFVFGKRSARPGLTFDPANPPNIHPLDAEFVRDVFWDLFRQGFITLGKDSSHNAGWPWFRLSHFAAKTLQGQSPYRFHDTASFLAIVRKAVPDISDEAVVYLDEAVAAFYADCSLASCVMLGVAAEAEFLRLIDVAITSAVQSSTFGPVFSEKFIGAKVKKFQVALRPLIPALSPKSDFENVDTNLSLIQAVLRVARNDAGHPSKAAPPQREQVYVFLQLFVPFAEQVMQLRKALV
jgi:hypothetical protein